MDIVSVMVIFKIDYMKRMVILPIGEQFKLVHNSWFEIV